MTFFRKCLFLKCCLCIATICFGPEFVLKKRIHSPLATDLCVEGG